MRSSLSKRLQPSLSGIAKGSVGCAGKSMHKRADAVPHNLHTDANKEKRRKPQNDAHAALTHGGGQSVSKAVTNVNAHRDDCRANDCSKDGEQVGPEMMRQVSPERDSH